MSRLRHFLAAASLLTITGVGTVLAQTGTNDLDLAAINRRVESDAAALTDLISKALARQSADNATKDAAQKTVDAANSSMAASAAQHGHALPGSGPIDLDAMVADAGRTMAPAPRSAPQFMAFASLAMPQDSLRQMINDVSRAGGTVVFRGFSPAGAGAFMRDLSQAIPPGTRPRISIDPRLFKAFNVEVVPTYVAVSERLTPCPDSACTANPEAFDKVSGNVTAAFAAETMAGGDGPGAAVARAAMLALKATP